MVHIFLTKTESNTARCYLCRSYLSVGPIWITSNYQPICGRCKVPPNDAKHRAIFFEKIAKYTFFPCRYDVHGCHAQLPWGSVLNHEFACKFAPIKCPALTCNDDIKAEHVEEHFKNKHLDLVMATNEFKIPCSGNVENICINRLFKWKNNPYLVQICYYQETCFFNILSFDKSNNEVYYDLTIGDSSRTEEVHMKNQSIRIKNYVQKKHDYSVMKKLDVSRLLSNEVFCTFSISGKKSEPTNPLNEKLLSDLECPVCFQYMNFPIYMCDSGHSICKVCKDKLTNCPTCTQQLRDSRNYTLEKISEHVLYPCKFKQDGCNFMANFQDLSIHEHSCTAFKANSGNFWCMFNSMNSCPWVGDINKFSQHLKVSHAGKYYNLGTLLTFEWCGNFENMMFTSYDEEIFRIRFNYGNKVGLRVHLAKVTKFKKNCYRLNVCLLKGDDEMLSLTRRWGENSLDISQSLIRPFLKRNKFTVTLNMTESQ